jgi:hypothetical protein
MGRKVVYFVVAVLILRGICSFDWGLETLEIFTCGALTGVAIFEVLLRWRG